MNISNINYCIRKINRILENLVGPEGLRPPQGLKELRHCLQGQKIMYC